MPDTIVGKSFRMDGSLCSGARNTLRREFTSAEPLQERVKPILCFRGIAWAPACGKAIAELVVNGESTSVNLDPFDPARFTPETRGPNCPM